jgi:hypothetical protein
MRLGGTPHNSSGRFGALLLLSVIKLRNVMYKNASTFTVHFGTHYNNTRRHIPEEYYLDVSILFAFSLQILLQESQPAQLLQSAARKQFHNN